jgi:hypothetical protein
LAQNQAEEECCSSKASEASTIDTLTWLLCKITFHRVMAQQKQQHEEKERAIKAVAIKKKMIIIKKLCSIYPYTGQY